MGGELSSPRGKRPRTVVPLAACRKSPEVGTPVRRWKEDGRGPEVVAAGLAHTLGSFPSLVQRSGCERLSPKSRGLYGTVPSRPPRGPARRGGGSRPTPPASPAAAAAADRAPIGPESSSMRTNPDPDHKRQQDKDQRTLAVLCDEWMDCQHSFRSQQSTLDVSHGLEENFKQQKNLI
ncbi:uncharacterized protein LOC143441801 isoform X2 [Arvicanthis niloticus]|uniref:uncharacterized protein LOC143312030 isoform X2 n=1 Tax=Arvicanthis niloticus TaxID=61156 RepID=UPI00402BBD7C